MCYLEGTGVRSPGSSSLDRIPASGHGFPPPPAPAPPLSRPKQAPTPGATPLPAQAAAPALARHSCQQQAASARHTRNDLAQYAPRPPIPHAPQSSPRYCMFLTVSLQIFQTSVHTHSVVDHASPTYCINYDVVNEMQ